MEEVFGGGSPLSAPPSLTPSEAVDDNEDVDIPSGPQSPRLSPPMVFTDEDEEVGRHSLNDFFAVSSLIICSSFPFR